MGSLCIPFVSPTSSQYLFGCHSSAFLFEVIGWAYFQAINDPMQQLVSKKGVGLFLRVGVLSGDYGNFWDNFEWFQDSRTQGQLLGVSQNSGTVGKYECGSQDTTVSTTLQY